MNAMDAIAEILDIKGVIRLLTDKITISLDSILLAKLKKRHIEIMSDTGKTCSFSKVISDILAKGVMK